MQQAAAVVMTTAFQKHVQATLVKNMFLAFISSGGGSGGGQDDEANTRSRNTQHRLRTLGCTHPDGAVGGAA